MLLLTTYCVIPKDRHNFTCRYCEYRRQPYFLSLRHLSTPLIQPKAYADQYLYILEAPRTSFVLERTATEVQSTNKINP